MAWTEMGGKILVVQAIQYRSHKQKIEVTGQLGDVMKESVGIAVSWIKSNFEDIISPKQIQLTPVDRRKIFE